MKPLNATEIRGVWGTLLLPVDDHGGIRWDLLDEQLGTLLTSGVDGVYAHGTAGEFHTLTEPEFDRISELIAGRCEAAGMAFQIGATHPSAQLCLDRVRRARAVAPGAIQVILPDWLPLSDDECLAFVSRVAEEAAPVPLVLYNPPHAKTQISPSLLGRLLAEAPSVVGVKVAGGDDAWFEQVRVRAPGCSLFVAGHRLASGMARGAHGSYSNIAAMSPAGAVAWYRQILGEPAAAPAAALDVERRIAGFFAAHITPLQARGLSNPALDKFLAAVGGWAEIGLGVRWPYASAPAAAVEEARSDARVLLPELFPSLS
ncbi:dihydrodipicolinate synthase family protein [Phytoactinopolyspora alkaliphila]|uniref:Dihydrodipicolinate synthase family protein n=1 Tax=Phytoactinopolyspora alkaliphila TaxID=1783498 RepID=A0A6N9YIN2_9ACTN|nr:dihydrodipicolinate synthase family protein [Phytoactinopolyspora alkaliphila]NED94824.1 dihydrodipicolinate synthase family protein [Phytoactinopolyspora alkaliphila]